MRSIYIALVATALFGFAGSGPVRATGMMDAGHLLAFQSDSDSGLAAIPASPDDVERAPRNRPGESAGESDAMRPGRDAGGGGGGAAELLPTGEPAPPAVDTPRRSGHRWQSLVPGAIK